MKLHHLRAFVAVAEAGSFGGAARELSLGQPALSKEVAALERELGAPLFVRGPQGVHLTAAGDVLIGEARKLLELSEQAIAETRAAASSAAGTLRLGHAELAHSHEGMLGSVLAVLATRHPRLAVLSRRMSSAEQWRALRERRIHVGIGYGEPAEAGGLAHEHLADLSITGVLLPAGHPLAARSGLRFSDLAELPLLLFPREVNPPLHDRVLAGLRERGLVPRLRPWMHSHAAFESAVRAGHGYTLAAHGASATPDGVVARQVDDPPIPTFLSMWWRDDDDEQSVQAFREAARAVRTAN